MVSADPVRDRLSQLGASCVDLVGRLRTRPAASAYTSFPQQPASRPCFPRHSSRRFERLIPQDLEALDLCLLLMDGRVRKRRKGSMLYLMNDALGLRQRSVFQLIREAYRCSTNHPPGSTRRQCRGVPLFEQKYGFEFTTEVSNRILT
jgi:hypothetical protein